jgi:hypothetical protein
MSACSSFHATMSCSVFTPTGSKQVMKSAMFVENSASGTVSWTCTRQRGTLTRHGVQRLALMLQDVLWLLGIEVRYSGRALHSTHGILICVPLRLLVNVWLNIMYVRTTWAVSHFSRAAPWTPHVFCSTPIPRPSKPLVKLSSLPSRSVNMFIRGTRSAGSRAKQPMWSKLLLSWHTPSRGTVSKDSLMPYIPFTPAG